MAGSHEPHWNRYRNEYSLRREGANFKGVLQAVQTLEARDRVRQADSTRKQRFEHAVQNACLVLNIDVQAVAISDGANGYPIRLRAHADSVMNCILEQRLQKQGGHSAQPALLLNLKLELQSVSKTALLDAGIVFEKIDLTIQRDFLPLEVLKR